MINLNTFIETCNKIVGIDWNCLPFYKTPKTEKEVFQWCDELDKSLQHAIQFKKEGGL